jgi:hypothetical protein
MGQASARSRSREAVLANEPRCIYCADEPATLEHMPPLIMFASRRRPSGFEFAACNGCNRATSPADLVASFFARLNRSLHANQRLTSEAVTLRNKLAKLAPGVLEELFRWEKTTRVWLRDSRLVATPFAQIKVDGPRTTAYLHVFAAKLAMALYREHVGHALPLTGGVHTNWFLNAGLAQRTAEGILKILPGGGTLRQGSFQVPEQFAYRYNCDGRTVVAALAGFHSNLHVFVVATSTPNLFKMPRPIPHSDFLRPGELVARIPQRLLI